MTIDYLKEFFQWIIAIFLFLAAVGSYNKNLGAFLLFITAAIFSTPTIYDYLKDKYNLDISKNGKIAIVIFLFVVGSIVLSDLSDTNVPDEYYTVEQYNELLNDYNQLYKNYMGLQNKTEQYASEVEQYVSGVEDLLEDYGNIPSTPASADVEYRLYGGPSGKASQIVIEHTNLTISGMMGTGSMSPGISSQSMAIETTSFDPYTLTPGQIISYEPEEVGDQTNIIHRIHSINQTGEFCYETKGDANFYSDPECVKPEQIETLVIGVIFRKPGERWHCDEELEYGPSSQYCPG